MKLRSFAIVPLFFASLLALVVGMILRPLARSWWWLRTRMGRMPTWCAVGVDAERHLNFSWAGDEASARQGIEGAFELLAALLPRLGLVTSTQSLLVRNPETGFCIRPERLQRLTRNFGSSQSILLWGESLEFGKLQVNDSVTLDLDELDFRLSRDCRLSVLLSNEECAAAAERLLPELVGRFGFSLAQ